MPQKHSELWFKELKTMAPKKLKKHTDPKKLHKILKPNFQNNPKIKATEKVAFFISKKTNLFCGK